MNKHFNFLEWLENILNSQAFAIWFTAIILIAVACTVFAQVMLWWLR